MNRRSFLAQTSAALAGVAAGTARAAGMVGAPGAAGAAGGGGAANPAGVGGGSGRTGDAGGAGGASGASGANGANGAVGAAPGGNAGAAAGSPSAEAAGGSKGELRLALISAATYGRGGNPRTLGSNHGTAFATTLNGWDEQKAKTWKGVFVRSQRRLAGARVVTVWDPDPAAAKQLADICSIPRVASTPEAACEGVDAVLLIDDGSGEQWKYALHPLQQGVPVFCDKPLAMTARDAQRVAKIARATKTRFMSASSLRFVPDIVKLKQELPQLGEVHIASASCGNELVYYGIHALSMIYGVLGAGAVSALNVGRPGRNLVRYRFKNDLDVMLTVADPAWMRSGYLLTLQGTKAWRTLQPDLTNLYSYLLEAFLDFLRTGRESVPIEEEVELIAALEAGQRSLQLGREVTIAEVLQG